jgi:hypothetical protein
MKQSGQFLLFNDRKEFKDWLFKTQFQRKITRIQEHHEYSPDYNAFYNSFKSNHFALLESNKEYHVKTDGFHDIAQNLTTFPDGSIAVCRSFEDMPAGIKGANQDSLCIENVGDFDSGHDTMTADQKETIIFLTAVLCMRFKLIPSIDTILYHHWFDLNSGVRTNGTGCTKTCPGTNFFGGYTVESAQKNFIPLVQERIKELSNELTLEEAVGFIKSKGGLTGDVYWIEQAKSGKVQWLDALLIKIAMTWKG